MKKFYQLTQKNDVAELYIYGDITSSKWFEEDVTAKSIVDEINSISANTIYVYISSYGGEVQAGLAIYNALKRHKAKVRTYCDGFACSIASVIFMAGDERIMNDSSLLMIHNAWTFTQGNAEELRKQADDLEKITQASVVAYKAHSTLSEEEIKTLMDNETWILPEEATEWGFATAIEKTEKVNASQNAKMCLLGIIKKHREELDEANAEGEGDDEDNEGEETPETDSDNPETPPDDEDEETPEDEENTEDEETEDEPTDEEAAQKWSGIFNALKKL